jgi:hypothetical protein
MIELKVDATDARQWATAASRVPTAMRTELVTSMNAVLAEGVGLAQEAAPVYQGPLRASIGVVQRPVYSGGGVTASYGTRGIIYAWIQEKGGVIRAKAGGWLTFKTRDGKWVRVKSVTIKGKHYIEKSKQALMPRARIAFRAAVSRALKSVGGA